MNKIPEDIKLMEERIQRLKAQENKTETPEAEAQFFHATRLGFRISAELLSGVIVGAGIGYLLDMFFQTHPVHLIILTFLGAIAGFLNIYPFVKSQEKRQE